MTNQTTKQGEVFNTSKSVSHAALLWPRVLPGGVVLPRFREYVVDEQREEFRREYPRWTLVIPFGTVQGRRLYREFRITQLALHFASPPGPA